MQKKFETEYGYFRKDSKEYIITNHITPRPWVNVISNGNYSLVVSQIGGGFSWITHSNLNRLTRWKQDLIRDNWGKYIYLRDEETGEYWSPTVAPVMKEQENFQCRHGIGYTVFQNRYKEISSLLRLFVPINDDLEIWTLQLSNLGKRPRRIQIFTYFEWCLGTAPDAHREFHKTFIETKFDVDHQVLLALKRLWEIPTENGHWNTSWNRTAYFACSENVDGFEGDKEAFIGKYGNLAHPGAVSNGKLLGHQGKWNDSIAALEKRVVLSPGEKKQIHFFLGAEESRKKIYYNLEKYRDESTIDAAFIKVRQHWGDLLDASTIDTPDEAMNLMANVWLKYQAVSCRLWARAAYYQQSGAYGFRDQLQDSQIFLDSQPELTKNQILLHAAHQFSDGRVLHWWHPITEEGLDAGASDDLLWLPFMTILYLKETAEWNFLNTPSPYYDMHESQPLLHHCLQAIDFSLQHFSPRGLPLILSADWNDGLSAAGLKGKGESLWLAHFLYYLLKEFIRILDNLQLAAKVNEYQKRAVDLQRAINEFGWDGEWFWRASKDNGELIGSKKNTEGKIFLNAQTWSIIAKSTDEKRQVKVMQKVEENLESKVGPMLLHPAYQVPDPLIGYLTRYAPGVRENGGVYTHAATWMIWAECLLGRNDAAYRIFKKICPIYNNQNADTYLAEPYVTPGNIDGIESPNYGHGGWTWYTGSAAWLHNVIVDHILGIKAEYDGLLVKPCLPSGWQNVYVKRKFRGATYHIHIHSSGEKNAQLKQIIVDGKVIKGNLIPVIKDKSFIQVQVEIG